MGKAVDPEVPRSKAFLASTLVFCSSKDIEQGVGCRLAHFRVRVIQGLSQRLFGAGRQWTEFRKGMGCRRTNTSINVEKRLADFRSGSLRIGPDTSQRPDRRDTHFCVG